MRTKANRALVDAVKADARDAWDALERSQPRERVYAFCVYTNACADFLAPTACAEEGLRRVAADYVRKKMYPDVDEAVEGLRWSVADSPHHSRLARFSTRATKALSCRPRVHGLPGAASEREVRARHAAAATALKELDAEGLFGRGAARRGILLLLAAGDGEDEQMLKWARRLNPAAAVAPLAKTFERERVGTFTELGTKRVRETRGIEVSADRSLVATASTHYVCLFDVRRMRQLWCREFATGRVGEEVHGVAMTRDGAAVAAITGSDRNHRHLVVWRGPRWSQRRDVPLPVIPLAVAMCPRGTWVAVAGSDRRVRVFGPDLEPVTSLRGHSDWPRALAVSPDGSRLASADRKGGIRLWDTSDWSAVRTIAGPADCLAFDSTGGRLVASVRQAAGRRRGSPSQPSSSVAVYDATTGKRRSEFRMHRYRFTAAALSPSGRTIACGIEAVADILDQQAVLIDARSGRVVDRLVADFGGHDAFAFLPKRGAVAVGAEGHGRRPLVLWKVSKRAA